MILSAISLKMEILNKAIIESFPDALWATEEGPETFDSPRPAFTLQPLHGPLARCNVGVDLSLQPRAKTLKEAQTQISSIKKVLLSNLKKNIIKRSF